MEISVRIIKRGTAILLMNDLNSRVLYIFDNKIELTVCLLMRASD